MEEYKGLYHKDDKIINSFEHGAHFKYSDLVNALKELQMKNNKNNEQILETEDYSQNNNKSLILKEKHKKRKKYKLKLYTENNNDNQRYSNIDLKEDEKYENKNRKDSFNNKEISKPISKSVARSQDNLPKISYNNILNNKKTLSIKNKSTFNPRRLIEARIINNNSDNDNDNEINQIKKKIKNKDYENDKEEYLPKIDSFYYKQITKENEEKKSNFFNENSHSQSKKYNKLDINNLKYNSIKKSHNIRLNKFNYNDNNKNDINIENSNYKGILSNRIRSIFETEKIIKNKNNKPNRIDYYDKNYFGVINNDITQQIYQLKKHLLIDTNKI